MTIVIGVTVGVGNIINSTDYYNLELIEVCDETCELKVKKSVSISDIKNISLKLVARVEYY